MQLKAIITAMALIGIITTPALAINKTEAAQKPPNVQTYTKAPYRGVNLGGGAFNNNAWNMKAGVYDKYHFVPYAPDGDLFYDKGANTFRIPVSWEYLAGKNMATTYRIDTSSHNTYYQNVKNLLTNLQRRYPGVHIILDLHNYMHYSTTGNLTDDWDYGAEVQPADKSTQGPSFNDFENIWSDIETNLVKPIDSDDKTIMLELMNEPYSNIGDTSKQAATFDKNIGDAYYHIITTILKHDTGRKFILDGTNWSGLHSWDMPASTSEGFLTKTDKPITDMLEIMKSNNDDSIKQHLIIDVHQYFDTTSTGDYLKHHGCDANRGETYFKQVLKFMEKWSKTNKIPFIIGETGIPEFEESKYTKPCVDDMKALWNAALTYKQSENAEYGFLGIDLWSAGHAWGVIAQNNIAPGACQINFKQQKPITGTPNDYFYNPKYGFIGSGDSKSEIFNPLTNKPNFYDGHDDGGTMGTISNLSSTNVYPINMPYIDPNNPADINNGEHVGKLADTATCNMTVAHTGKMIVYNNSLQSSPKGADAIEFFIPSKYDSGLQSDQLIYGAGQSGNQTEKDGYIYIGQEHKTPDGYMVSPIAWGDPITGQPYYTTNGKNPSTTPGHNYEQYVKSILDQKVNNGKTLADILPIVAIVDSGYQPSSAKGTIKVTIDKGTCIGDDSVQFANESSTFTTNTAKTKSNVPSGQWTVSAKNVKCNVKSITANGTTPKQLTTFTLPPNVTENVTVTLQKGHAPKPPQPTGSCSIDGNWVGDSGGTTSSKWYAQYKINDIKDKDQNIIWSSTKNNTDVTVNFAFNKLPSGANVEIANNTISKPSGTVTIPNHTYWLAAQYHAGNNQPFSSALQPPTCTLAAK